MAGPGRGWPGRGRENEWRLGPAGGFGVWAAAAATKVEVWPKAPHRDAMTGDEFVERSVALQVGAFRGPLDHSEEGLRRTLERCSGSAVGFRPGGGDAVILDASAGVLRAADHRKVMANAKLRGAFETIRTFRPDFPFVIDMQDRRVRTMAPEGGPVVAVFTFNRIVGDPQRILWPLSGYHDLGVQQFADAAEPGTVPWPEKRAQIVWRGIAGGRATVTEPGTGEGMRVKTAVRRYREGRMSEAALRGILMASPRYRILEMVQGDPRFDMGFVDGDGYVIAQTPLHAHLGRPRLTRPQMQERQFIAVLRGLDVGSSFYWVMNSGSTGFVMETPFETFGSGHFCAWEHFVPFREDGTDLHARLDWACSHPDEARGMAERAAAVAALLVRADLRARVLRGVMDTVAAMPRA